MWTCLIWEEALCKKNKINNLKKKRRKRKRRKKKKKKRKIKMGSLSSQLPPPVSLTSWLSKICRRSRKGWAYKTLHKRESPSKMT